MTLEKAIDLLEEEYARAKDTTFVCDPVAYSLYQVWKKADEDWHRKRGKHDE